MSGDLERFWREAQTAYARGNYAKSLELIDKIIRKQSGAAPALHLAGLIEYRRKRYPDAFRRFDSALKANPGFLPALVDAGRLARDTGEPERALDYFRRAAAVAPGIEDVSVDLARLHMALNQPEAAIAALDRFLMLVPNHATAQAIRGQLRLSMRDFAGGWTDYARRWQAPPGTFPLESHAHGLPPLPPGALPSEPVWLWGEQGLGDQILYASAIRDAAAAGLKPLIGVDRRLAALFRRSFAPLPVRALQGADQAALGDCRWQMSFGELASRWRVEDAAFGAGAPFLLPDAELRDRLRARYQAAHPGKKLVGLSWNSRAGSKPKPKSMQLAQLAPALAHPDIVFVDIQYGITQEEIAALARDTGIALHHDASINAMDDLDAYAAQIAALDAVVSVSNTAAHLAGALGLPGIILLPANDGLLWYWFRAGDRSPWYRSLHLLRQSVPGEWAPAIQGAAHELRRLLAVG